MTSTKISVKHISEEYRGTMFFGKLVLFPFSVMIDWADMWTFDEDNYPLDYTTHNDDPFGNEPW